MRDVLRGYAASVLNGSAPATLPQPAPVAAPLQIAPPTTRIFSTKALTWTDHDGTRRCEHAWTDIDVPPETANRAIRLGAACAMNDPRRKAKLGFAKNTDKPKPEACINLDLDTPATSDPRATEPVISGHRKPTEPAMFTPIDTGRKPFVIRTARAAE